MNCAICSEVKSNQAKYKCPKCRIPYCSILCWKKHKIIDCRPAIEVQNKSNFESTSLYNFPTEDTVPLKNLQHLELNRELKNILCNQHLRDMLVAIDKSTNPSAAMQQAMLEPIFVEFADECLKVVELTDRAN